MRRLVGIGMALSLVLGVWTVAWASQSALSLLSPPNPVVAAIRFEDTGSQLIITGHATGLTPGKAYVSLIYDIGSTVRGPDACEPTIFNPNDPNFILPTMFLGQWSVDSRGRGTLSVVNVAHAEGGRVYVPLSKIGTVSIRDVAINGGFGVEAVVSCGKV